MVTLSKGGTEERTVKISQVIIPDLWHIAQSLDDEDKKKCWNAGTGRMT
jgi:hypothetical protein